MINNSNNIRLLLYADDIVILADDVNVLQEMIHKLEEYCSKWKMEVNMTKSEIMVFRKGGRPANNERWSFNGQEIRVVKEYCYLGVLLTPG
ncbi:reverse transcriptase domain-containing protein, partial [Streptomyces sp. IBSBF 2390]|uniref:reverse transcriptase domain-containing protein n=1 Tax=Streptomyces sp. IBSBF 2390 TaxID=2903533 RepID=UPI003FA6F54B